MTLAAALLFAALSAPFQPVTAANTAQPPQVFVRDPSAQAAPGETGHIFGL
ncbi:MAG: hypothetical protein JO103_12645, partial [Candidatus Eremiobacteraeota bacterium]|nr:hypothetical protein [Candidatus Eremiobacteraeota bacterium]